MMYNRSKEEIWNVVKFCGLIVVLTTVISGCKILNSWKGKELQGEDDQGTAYISRGQEVFFRDNQRFAESIEELGLGMPIKTKTYQYSIHPTSLVTLTYAVSIPYKNSIGKSYVAGTFLIVDHATQDLVATSIICQTKAASAEKPSNPVIEENVIQCGEDTESFQLILAGGQQCCLQSIPIDQDVVLAHQAISQALAKRYTEARQLSASIQNPKLRSRVLNAIDPKAK